MYISGKRNSPALVTTLAFLPNIFPRTVESGQQQLQAHILIVLVIQKWTKNEKQQQPCVLPQLL